MMMDRAPMVAIGEYLRQAYTDVVGGRSFDEVMYQVRTELDSGATVLDELASCEGRCCLSTLYELAPGGDDRRWNRVVAIAVVVQSLLVGAQTDDLRYWSNEFTVLLDDLPDREWCRAVDGVVTNHAGSLLSAQTMRRAVELGPEAVSRTTLDSCCQALAASALARGDVQDAIWAVGQAASPFAIVGGFVETRGDTDERDLIRTLYGEIARRHATDAAHPTLTSAHWLMLGEPGIAESLLLDAVREARARPDSGAAWVAALVAVLVGRREVAEQLAQDIRGFVSQRRTLRGTAGDVPPVVAWILSQRIAEPRRRAAALQRCLHTDRVLGGLESRLWFDLAGAERDCGRLESADQALSFAAARRTVGADDRVDFDPFYGQMEALLAKVAVTDAELTAARFR